MDYQLGPSDQSLIGGAISQSCNVLKADKGQQESTGNPANEATLNYFLFHMLFDMWIRTNMQKVTIIW